MLLIFILIPGISIKCIRILVADTYRLKMALNVCLIFVAVFIAGNVSAQTKETLHMIVKIKNVETGQLVGVDTTNEGSNAVYAKEGLKYYDWILEPDCFPYTKKPSYRLRLANNTNYRWNHKSGCTFKDTDLIIYNLGTETNYNNYFVYDPHLETITVCDFNCIYVDPSSKELKSTNKCGDRDDQFLILFEELREHTSTSKINLDCFK
ncbi:uncharacterized protein [Diabrotica undecimpunctata]|uniref:uncharacterized protein n=1 Tax=Diabrotica undecimpunctata TaxID=50387 RepID=UPI003B638ADD